VKNSIRITLLLTALSAVGSSTFPYSWDYGYVSANVTVTRPDHRTLRAKVVSHVFAYCWFDQKQSAILADAKYQVMSTLRREFPNSMYDITYYYVATSSTRTAAQRAHDKDLADPLYKSHFEIPYTWAAYSGKCR
jgi:hypothetical protein